MVARQPRRTSHSARIPTTSTDHLPTGPDHLDGSDRGAGATAGSPVVASVAGTTPEPRRPVHPRCGGYHPRRVPERGGYHGRATIGRR